MQGFLFAFNDMRVYYEGLRRMLSVNGNNTLFSLSVSQIGGSSLAQHIRVQEKKHYMQKAVQALQVLYDLFIFYLSKFCKPQCCVFNENSCINHQFGQVLSCWFFVGFLLVCVLY